MVQDSTLKAMGAFAPKLSLVMPQSILKSALPAHLAMLWLDLKNVSQCMLATSLAVP